MRLTRILPFFFKFLILLFCGLFLSCNKLKYEKSFYNIKLSSLVAASYISCPTNYVRIESNSTFNLNHEFCVAKYEMKNVGGIATSQENLAPWTSITPPLARAACANLGAGYSMVSNDHWMTIAREVEQNANNWSNSTIGVGEKMTYGFSQNNPAATFLAASSNDNNSCFGINAIIGTCSLTNFNSERRIVFTKNNEVIWDLVGNAAEFINWYIENSPSSKPYVSGDGLVQNAFREFNLLDTFPSTNYVASYQVWPLNNTFTSANGIGTYYGGNIVAGLAIRGGEHDQTTNNGIYSLHFTGDDTAAAPQLGFRCVYEVPTSPSSGEILVDLGANYATRSNHWVNSVISRLTGVKINGPRTTSGKVTNYVLNFLQDFENVNALGTTTPNAALNIEPRTSSDSFYSSNSTLTTVQMRVDNLTASSYSFTFFCSIVGVADNRETRYTVSGANTSFGDLDCANNTTNTVTVSNITPDVLNQITISLEKGPANTNPLNLFYLNSFRISW